MDLKSPLIAVNIYMHDFCVALAFASSLISYLTVKNLASELNGLPSIEKLLKKFDYIFYFSFTGIFIFGAIRLYFYMDYEFLPSVKKGIIPLLVIKHIILATILFIAVFLNIKLRLKLKR